MSIIQGGNFIRGPQSVKANGGTEYMGEQIQRLVEKNLLDGVTIHFSRFERDNFKPGINILYVHDMPNDPMYAGVPFMWFDAIVFVSADQMSRFIKEHGYKIPVNRCHVIPNATRKIKWHAREIFKDSRVRFIYHTTPHRGLEELVNGFDLIKGQCFPNATLDVYSSFDLYGWKDRDSQFENLFRQIKSRDDMRYYGYQPRQIIYEDALQKSDIFFYPNKWPETSCISLIEALRAGLICIVPDLYALRETANGYQNAIIYDPKVPIADLFAYLSKEIGNGKISNGIAPSINDFHDEDMFKLLWESLIEVLKWNTKTK